MTISVVAGSMLNSNLVRTNDLAFNGNVLYLNVGNNQVGINTSIPRSTLEVVGNLTIGNVLIPNVGNISIGNVNINNVADPTQPQDSATKHYVDSKFGNFSLANNTISTTNSNANIYLQANGTGEVVITGNSGFVIPAGNTSQQPATPAVGTVRFNTDTTQLVIWDGTQWAVATNSNSVITNQTINPDGSSNTFSLNRSTSSEAVIVTINGISQTPNVDYSVAGNVITFSVTPLSADTIQVRYIAYTTAISSVALGVYSVAQTANIVAPQTGQVVYVTNGDSGNACLAVYNGAAWKRVVFGATIST